MLIHYKKEKCRVEIQKNDGEEKHSFEGKGVSGVEEEKEGEREDSLAYLSTHVHAYITIN